MFYQAKQAQHFTRTTQSCAEISNQWLIVRAYKQALTNLDTWSRVSNICFNASKCKVLTVTRKKNPVIFDYHLGSQKLLRV